MIWCLSEMPPSDRYAAPPSPSVKCCCRCGLCTSSVIITACEPRQPSVCKLPLTNWGCRSKWDNTEHNTLNKKVSTNKPIWAREAEWNWLVQLTVDIWNLKLCQCKTKQTWRYPRHQSKFITDMLISEWQEKSAQKMFELLYKHHRVSSSIDQDFTAWGPNTIWSLIINKLASTFQINRKEQNQRSWSLLCTLGPVRCLLLVV